MMNLIALLLVLTGTANIDATGYLHQEILIIRNYNNNNDGLKKVKDVCDVSMMTIYVGTYYLRLLIQLKKTTEQCVSSLSVQNLKDFTQTEIAHRKIFMLLFICMAHRQ